MFGWFDVREGDGMKNKLITWFTLSHVPCITYRRVLHIHVLYCVPMLLSSQSRTMTQCLAATCLIRSAASVFAFAPDLQIWTLLVACAPNSHCLLRLFIGGQKGWQQKDYELLSWIFTLKFLSWTFYTSSSSTKTTQAHASVVHRFLF